MFETDHDDATKTMVTFVVKDANESQFVITKRIPTGAKTQEQILSEAHSLIQDEVAAWASGNAIIGKTWNPETNSLEVTPA